MGSKHANLLELWARIEREGALARLGIGEAVALIASRARVDEELRLVRKRIRMRLLRSHKNGGDVTAGGLACGTDRRYTVDEIARWAQRRYPGLFDDLPTTGRNIKDVALVEAIGFCDITSEEVMPGNLADCQTELRKARALLKKAQLELQETKLDFERRLKLVGNFHKPS
jgi:hypothetical protein